LFRVVIILLVIAAADVFCKGKQLKLLVFFLKKITLLYVLLEYHSVPIYNFWPRP